ncbi:hypothetical protein GCM10007108_12450 [Thermogymnomonas acidicola]|uniref:Uncharacterized protein n=2 Tax=Thermogymnomonas acidicola TaxID=399579 RepID=A0AA37F9P1_9ARCH|nr:hypothetical protein GCM10007108_12450 [Thermogymnomonas acidicola]
MRLAHVRRSGAFTSAETHKFKIHIFDLDLILMPMGPGRKRDENQEQFEDDKFLMVFGTAVIVAIIAGIGLAAAYYVPFMHSSSSISPTYIPDVMNATPQVTNVTISGTSYTVTAEVWATATPSAYVTSNNTSRMVAVLSGTPSISPTGTTKTVSGVKYTEYKVSATLSYNTALISSLESSKVLSSSTPVTEVLVVYYGQSDVNFYLNFFS